MSNQLMPYTRIAILAKYSDYTVIKRIQVEAEKGRTRISHMLRLIDGWESEVNLLGSNGMQWL